MITLTIAQLKILQGKSEVRMFTLRPVSIGNYFCVCSFSTCNVLGNSAEYRSYLVLAFTTQI